MKEYKPVFDHQTTIFTSRFLFFIVLSFFLISLLNYQSDMTVLTLIVIGIILFTMLWSRFSVSKLKIEFKVDKHRVFPDEEIKIDVRAENNKLLPVCLKISLEFAQSFFVSKSPASSNSFLLWFQRSSFTWKLTSLKRGCFNIGHPQIAVSDLFGFFPKQQTRNDSADLIVFPKISGIRPFSLPEQKFFSIPGARSPVLDPVYIIGTRDYQSSTPARLIHWKPSARLCKLQEKVCEPSIQGKVLLVVDVNLFFENRAEEDFERMLEATASMAVYFERKGNAVGFMTNAKIAGAKSGFIPLSRNRNNLPMILETIARMEMKSACSLADIFHHHISVLWGINCIFCSYSIDESILKMKAFYTAKRIPVKYFVSSTDALKEDMAFALDSVHPIDSICL